MKKEVRADIFKYLLRNFIADKKRDKLKIKLKQDLLDIRNTECETKRGQKFRKLQLKYFGELFDVL